MNAIQWEGNKYTVTAAESYFWATRIRNSINMMRVCIQSTLIPALDLLEDSISIEFNNFLFSCRYIVEKITHRIKDIHFLLLRFCLVQVHQENSHQTGNVRGIYHSKTQKHGNGN